MANNVQPSLIEIAIEPKSRADQEKLDVALAQLAAEDPSFRVSTDVESGQTILTGTSELHLATKIDILKRTYKVEANIGAPQVAYREKITKKVTVDYTYKKQTGGTGQFAQVKLVCEPLPPGSTFVFENEVVGGSVPEEFIPGVEKGLESVLRAGVLAGFPVVDLKVTLIDGRYHEVDSSALAFEIAARMALRDALQKGSSVLFEPIMKVEVVTPEDCTGLVAGDSACGAGRSMARTCRAAPASSLRWYRLPTCSGTSIRCGRSRRAAGRSRCGLTTMRRYRCLPKTIHRFRPR
jgi:elongation factor G